MTTRIHVVNFGPDVINVTAVDPETNIKIDSGENAQLYPQHSCDIYVHSSQAVRVIEVKP